jgi:putative oxidoreductase
MEFLRLRALSLGLLWLRILMGLGIASHGYGKLFSGRMPAFIEAVGQMGFPFPAFFGWSAALAEFIGGILIVLGLQTRLAAAAVFVTMMVAAFVRHAPDTFSVKELALAYWTMAGALILTGAGVYSLDARRKRDV